MVHQQVYDQYLSAGFKDMNLDLSRRAKDYEPIFGSLLPGDKKARILDLGCGMGNFLYYLKEKGYHNFQGIDIGREAVDFCKKKVTEKVTLIESLSDYLQDHQNEFDLVVMNDVIEHLPKLQTIATLEGVRRSLKKGGRVIIQTGNITTLSSKYCRYMAFDHEIVYSEYSLRQVLAVAGFQDIRVFGNANPWRPNIKRILWLSAQKIWFAILKMIYVIELGSDAPKIISKLLIAVGSKG